MSIERQMELLTELARIVHESASEGYSEARCEFDYECSEKDWTVGSSFSYVLQGVGRAEFLNDPNDRTSQLVHELHELMRQHTGGSWKEFVLSIDANGKAHTNFVY
ncbi:hypothetical protein DXT74_15220 [Chromobacterium sp. Rain0013]|nr:hypothetical protein DXT74_15220 [Chromobacterium sp. Rain0013]